MAGLMRILTKAFSHEPEVAARPREYLNQLDERMDNAFRQGQSTLSIRPIDCSIWSGNIQLLPRPTKADCEPLLNSIAQENGNTMPAIVRANPPGSAQPYELIAGTRRHFCVDWLNRNGRPEIRLNVLLVELTDEEAFRLLDMENRERKDLPEIDKARGYSHALTNYYDGVQSRMSEALGLSGSQLSRLLSLADLPEEVVNAFGSRDELRVRHSEVLTPVLRKPEQAKLVLAEAKRIAAEQEHLCGSGEKLIPAAGVLQRLKEAGQSGKALPSNEEAVLHDGACLGHVSRTSNGVTITMTIPEGIAVDDALDSLCSTINSLPKTAKVQ